MSSRWHRRTPVVTGSDHLTGDDHCVKEVAMTKGTLLALALVCGATTPPVPAGTPAGEKGKQTLHLSSAYFPNGSPAGGRTVTLSVELDGQGGGTGWIGMTRR